jgi:threonine/homoserine/homoserine lactone efflux protein
VLIGLSIAAPVGPIGVLCIRRSLAEGARAGFASGLGAASADAVYGSLAAFGLTAVSQYLIEQQSLIRLVGGLILLVVGLRAFLAAPIEPIGGPEPSAASGLPAAYASAFALTITNPMTIVSFAAVFAGLGLDVARGDYAAAAVLVLGVFAGSVLWWLTLSSVAGLLRRRIGLGALRWINRASGIVIAVFGISVLVSLL